MRHGMRSQRLRRPTDQRDAMLESLVKGLIQRGQIQTTLARAKETQRLADRLVSLGKEGSIHARRRAFRVLQDRTLVSRLFTEIAPRFTDMPGGYTRVLRGAIRRGDGAQKAVLQFSRLPAVKQESPKAKAAEQPKAPKPSKISEAPAAEETEKKGFFEGLRGLWKRKKGSVAT